MDDSISTSTYVFYTRRNDGIVVQCIKPGARQELKGAQENKENIEAFVRRAGGRRRLLLVDVRGSAPTSQRSRLLDRREAQGGSPGKQGVAYSEPARLAQTRTNPPG